MNWRREAIDKLKNYEVHKLALENLPKEIKRLESAYAGIRSATTDGTPVSGGGNTREDSMLSNIVHRDELKRRLKEARLWVSMVDKALAIRQREMSASYANGYMWSNLPSIASETTLCGDLPSPCMGSRIASEKLGKKREDFFRWPWYNDRV